MGRSPKSEGIEEVPRQPSGDASRPRGSLLGTCPKVREPVEQRAPAGRRAVGYGGLVRQTRCSPFLGKKAKCKSPRNGFPAGAGSTARRGLRGTCPQDTLLALPRTSESGVRGVSGGRESPGNLRGAPPDPVGASSALVQKSKNRSSSGRRDMVRRGLRGTRPPDTLLALPRKKGQVQKSEERVSSGRRQDSPPWATGDLSARHAARPSSDFRVRGPRSEGIEGVPRQPSGDASRPRGSLLGTCPKVREPVEQRAPAGRRAVGY